MYKKYLSLFTLLSFVLYLAGCTTMRHVTYQEISGPECPPSVQVKLDDGTKYQVKEPRIEQNRLVGNVDGEGHKEIDLVDIEWVGVKETDKKDTLKWAAVGAAGAGILVWILASSGKSQPRTST